MNFILTINGRIIFGPKPWNRRQFEFFIQDELGETHVLPDTNTELYTIAESIKIWPAVMSEPEEFNPKIQQYAGPFWTYTDGIAYGVYQAIAKPLEEVRSNLKSLIAAKRYEYEVAGTTCEIQGVNVTVDTSREGRQVFVQQLMLMSDTDTIRWKFPEAWLTLSKPELSLIVSTGVSYIKSQFEWEDTKVAELNSISDLQQLNSVLLEKEVVNGNEYSN